MNGPRGVCALSVGGLAMAPLHGCLEFAPPGLSGVSAIGLLVCCGLLLRNGWNRGHVDLLCAATGAFLFAALTVWKAPSDPRGVRVTGRRAVRCVVLTRTSYGDAFEKGLANDDLGRLIQLSGSHIPQPGSRVLGVVEPLSPPRAEHGWEFDGEAHDRSKGIHQRWRWHQTLVSHPADNPTSRWRGVWDGLRREVRARILLDSEEAGPAFLLGMMTGDKSALPRPVRQAFSEVGLGHLTAVSGFHVGLVLAGCMALMRWVGVRSRWRGAMTMPVVWSFVLLCGLPASAARAAVMATAWAVARSLNRTVDGLTAWSFAGWLLVCQRPAVVLDVGAQLSFLATLGILMWHRGTHHSGMNEWVRAAHSALAISTVATVFTAPVAWPTFGQMPVVFPLSNLLATPSAMVLAVVGTVQVLCPGVPGLNECVVVLSGAFVDAVMWLAEWQPAIRLPLDEAVLRWSGSVLCAGFMLGFLRRRMVVWSVTGVVWAVLLLRLQSGLEFGVQGVRWENGATAIRMGPMVTVFDCDGDRRHAGTWKTRSFVERVSARGSEPACCVEEAFKVSSWAIQAVRNNDTLLVTRRSRSHCGSLDPHTSPRPPCP